MSLELTGMDLVLQKSSQAQLVCSEHFEFTCFTLTTRMHWQQGLPYKAALTDEAVPTLFGLQIQEYKKRVENPSSRGAFRKRELERIIGEYEVTPTGNAEQPLPVTGPALLQPSTGQVKEALTIHSDAELPEVSENGPCVSENNQESEDSLSVQTERANLPIKTSEENKSQCPPQCAQDEASDLIKEDGRCLCIKPETTSTGTQVKPGTTVKGVQVSRKVQVTNAVKGSV
ncbi:uncharacterized protein LOC132723950 [Ruditapes philippinarum]|uniref:uncharacterized protein LOC132723950 n=1 Tax=Ruditapes philippinarum TaxID=129788 RepID=UPI00295C273E|nr:uncharacterized protein LOC132723950 [Ruditapes philippinarum]